MIYYASTQNMLTQLLPQDWQALNQRPLGDLIFPRGSAHALPERIAEGDLDGDLYWVCDWDHPGDRKVCGYPLVMSK